MTHPLIETAIDTHLRSAIQQAYGLEQLRHGRHTIRDSHGQKTVKLHVTGLWIVEIRPTFAPSAALAFVSSDRGDSVFLGINGSHGVTGIGPLLTETDFPDTLQQAMQKVDLWSTDQHISLDGIGYTVVVDTYSVQAAIQFANPRNASLIQIEQGIMQIVAWIAISDRSDKASDYLRTLQPYVNANRS